jgi:hypothetical protein
MAGTEPPYLLFIFPQSPTIISSHDYSMSKVLTLVFASKSNPSTAIQRALMYAEAMRRKSVKTKSSLIKLH